MCKCGLDHFVELTILVIDDDLDCRELLAAHFEHVGHAVVVAENGREAMRLLTRGQLRPDVILLDLAMPAMDGAAFAEQVATDVALRSIPLIIISAFGAPEAPTPKNALLRFIKPLDHKKLDLAVRQVTKRTAAVTPQSRKRDPFV